MQQNGQSTGQNLTTGEDLPTKSLTKIYRNLRKSAEKSQLQVAKDQKIYSIMVGEKLQKICLVHNLSLRTWCCTLLLLEKYCQICLSICPDQEQIQQLSKSCLRISIGLNEKKGHPLLKKLPPNKSQQLQILTALQWNVNMVCFVDLAEVILRWLELKAGKLEEWPQNVRIKFQRQVHSALLNYSIFSEKAESLSDELIAKTLQEFGYRTTLPASQILLKSNTLNLTDWLITFQKPSQKKQDNFAVKRCNFRDLRSKLTGKIAFKAENKPFFPVSQLFKGEGKPFLNFTQV